MQKIMKTFITLALLFLAALSGSSELRADEFRFIDSSDNVTLEHTGALRTFNPQTFCIYTGQCESIGVAIRSNNGAFTTPSGSNPTINIAGEPDGNSLSDTITIDNLGTGSVQANLTFDSYYAEVGGANTCLLEGVPCTITENGMVQTAGYIHWNDGTTDTVQFQSDVETSVTPEPSSLLLYLTGLLVILGILVRR